MAGFSLERLTTTPALDVYVLVNPPELRRAAQPSFEEHLRKTPPQKAALARTTGDEAQPEEPKTPDVHDAERRNVTDDRNREEASETGSTQSDKPGEAVTGEEVQETEANEHDQADPEEETALAANAEAKLTAEDLLAAGKDAEPTAEAPIKDQTAIVEKASQATNELLPEGVEVSDMAQDEDAHDAHQEKTGPQGQSTEKPENHDLPRARATTGESPDVEGSLSNPPADEEPTSQPKKRKRDQPAHNQALAARQPGAEDIATAQSEDGGDAALDAIQATTRRGTRQREVEPTQSSSSGQASEAGATSASAPSRISQHLAGRGSERGGRPLGMTASEQTRFVDRVARAFQFAEGRGGTLRLKLSPPELGSLRLEVKVQGGVLSARVEADTPLARSLLLDNLPVLRERLAEQGVRIDQFDVDLLDRHSSGTPDGPEQNQHGDQDSHPQQPRHSPETEDVEAAPLQRTPTAGGDEQLNVIV